VGGDDGVHGGGATGLLVSEADVAAAEVAAAEVPPSGVTARVLQGIAAAILAPTALSLLTTGIRPVHVW
jgi:hypothetical protein